MGVCVVDSGLFLNNLSMASFSLLSSKSLCLAKSTSFMSLVFFKLVSVCFSFVLKRPSSIFSCSCWKAAGEIGIVFFFLDFLTLIFSESLRGGWH